VPTVSRVKLRSLLNYNQLFYAVQRERSGRSAQEVVSLVNKLLQPKSVVDVGCGIGAWLGVWREQGVTDVLGIDGDWVDRGMLQIPKDQFVAHDLSQPYEIDRSYDLAMSLEVGEHLDSGDTDAFVDLLTSLAPVVLFSAAIPNQGGQHHVNERWQGDWAKDFERRGYLAVDCVRPQIWDNENVQVWYRQNIVVYVQKDALADNQLLGELVDTWKDRPISLVHPDLYSTMFLRAASAFVRQYRGIRVKTVVKGLVGR
jgi:trans-aconitate methyltransferase